MELHFKEIDTSTPQGLRRAVQFEKENPEYKRITSTSDLKWIYEKEEKEKTYIIRGKGFINYTIEDMSNRDITYTDIKYKSCYIVFKGLESEKDKFIDELLKDESAFKYMTHYEKGSKDEQEYLYGPNNFLKKLL